MARTDLRTPRLHVAADLSPGAVAPIEQAQSHYLLNVLRLRDGDAVLAFNGRDGEWRTTIVGGKRTAALRADEQIRPQTRPTDLHYLFAPLKHARLDYMVQKATEMGVSLLAPVTTRHTQAARVNLDRMRANAIEAAEQCGILTLPAVAEPISLERALTSRAADRLLVFCDEEAEVQDPVAALAAHARGPIAVLVGPEGGFAEEERTALLRQPNVLRLALGPRILRADTAAVAVLTLVQAVLGDWK